MSTSYSFTYQVPPEMLKRAMTSWARPLESGKKRALRIAVFVAACAIIGFAIGVTGVFDRIPDGMALGLLIGFYAGLALWLVFHRVTAGRLQRLCTDQLSKQGPTDGVFDATGTTMRSNLGDAIIGWHAYDQVIRMADATALRLGGVIYPIPHAALPDGVTPDQFHADLVTWQAAAQ